MRLHALSPPKAARYALDVSQLCRNFDGLIPDAPELIHTYLEGEQDASCKRNAFMMLIHVDRVRLWVAPKTSILLWTLTFRIGLWTI